MNPPDVIARYFQAANAGNIEDARDCFAENAIVHDEGGTHTGRAHIASWVDDTTRLYQPKVELIQIREEPGSIIATALVSGNFPGSPIELDYTFALQGGTIEQLSIR